MSENKPAVTSLVVDAEAGTTASAKKPASRSGGKKSGSQNRRKSRELVLKAVYRGMLNDSELSQVFRDMRDDPDYNKADEAYFKHLLQAVTENLTAIDGKIVGFIDRTLEELSPVEHAILRIAGCELMFDLSIPYRVVINEGVELAKVFGGTDGHKYINGVLDKFAADVRAAEVKAARS
ncbi:transcription antitermination factor NusB [Methylotenera mobilis]|uniref:Transcription antitermination protein NusB n=1 Tax=Methylotenera mobilis (strain JLW8 / ATCC BAA-1282 / DSM 17540) TaxID=583345 RepID=C6WU13_METML|nr:transcription antitermination factor NusB [Methylotenera mobilis]ACT47412.1 NusB antitermination factor [Methylotenera mobilis JLW8]